MSNIFSTTNQKVSYPTITFIKQKKSSHHHQNFSLNFVANPYTIIGDEQLKNYRNIVSIKLIEHIRRKFNMENSREGWEKAYYIFKKYIYYLKFSNALHSDKIKDIVNIFIFNEI